MSNALSLMRALRLPDRFVVGIGLAFLLAGISGWLNYSLAFSWSVCLALTLGAALGACRSNSLGPFSGWFATALALWMVIFWLMHWLPDDTEELWLQLPPATAVGIVALWLAPFIFITLPYVLYFERCTLDSESLEEVRRLARNPRERM